MRALEAAINDATGTFGTSQGDPTNCLGNGEGCTSSAGEPRTIADKTSVARSAAGHNRDSSLLLLGAVVVTSTAFSFGEITKAVGATRCGNAVNKLELTVRYTAFEREEVPDLIDCIVSVAAKVNSVAISVRDQSI